MWKDRTIDSGIFAHLHIHVRVRFVKICTIFFYLSLRSSFSYSNILSTWFMKFKIWLLKNISSARKSIDSWEDHWSNILHFLWKSSIDSWQRTMNERERERRNVCAVWEKNKRTYADSNSSSSSSSSYVWSPYIFNWSRKSVVDQLLIKCWSFKRR